VAPDNEPDSENPQLIELAAGMKCTVCGD